MFVLALLFAGHRAYLILAKDFALDGYLLRAFLHVLHLDDLRRGLTGSLMNLHVQPPIWNLVVGLAAKAAGVLTVDVEHVLYAVQLAFGFGLVVTVYFISLRLLRRPLLSFALSAAWVVSPQLALYETWPLYGVLTPLLVTSSALFLVMAVQSGRNRSAIAAGALFGLLVLTRASYHVALIPLMAGVLLLVAGRRTALAFGLTAFALALPWYVKNQVMFGAFQASTISGCNIYRVAPGSSAHTPPPFLPVDQYPSGISPGRTHAAPQLGATYKVYAERGEQFTNLNNVNIIDICRWYGRSARRAATAEPTGLIKHWLVSSVLYGNPSTQHMSLRKNREKLGAPLAIYEQVLFAGLPMTDWPDASIWQKVKPSLIDQSPKLTLPFVLSIATLLICIAAFVRACRARGLRKVLVDLREFLPVLVLFLYGAAVSIAFELGENARFKLENEPLATILLAALVLRLQPMFARTGRSGYGSIPTATASGPPANRSPPA